MKNLIKIGLIKIGLIINPIAGMGGKVGLKGTDGNDIINKARNMGAEPQAVRRTEEFLLTLLKKDKNINEKITFLTIPGIMGGDLIKKLGFNHISIFSNKISEKSKLYKTTSNDTIQAAKLMKKKNALMIIFVGGDGTARNIFEAVDTNVPCLGIPAGVKIHSSVFAYNPKAAAEVLLKFITGQADLRESEVMDIDEKAFRDNRVVSKLYGFLQTPYCPTLFQISKMASPQTLLEKHNQESIAEWLINQMKTNNSKEDWYYLIGPGTTIKTIADLLNQEKTLLGVDFFHKKKLINRDLNEKQILKNIEEKKVKLIVAPIGAQGFVFGRGNLQLSPNILKKIGMKNIIIIATKYKISSIEGGKLRIDSRDRNFDEYFRGLHRVLVDYGELNIIEVI